MCNNIPHKHAAVIKAWADGAKIQVRIPQAGRLSHTWEDIEDEPIHWYNTLEYRVKPEPKPDVVTYAALRGVCEYRRPKIICSSNNDWNNCGAPSYTDRANIKFTFDGETGELKKAEVI